MLGIIECSLPSCMLVSPWEHIKKIQVPGFTLLRHLESLGLLQGQGPLLGKSSPEDSNVQSEDSSPQSPQAEMKQLVIRR